MNILEHMMALSLRFADLHREFAQDYAHIVAAYNPEGVPEDNLEEDGELNRINQKWGIRLQRLATIAVIGLAIGVAGVAYADDRVIKPTCWEENVNGEVHRHCEVKRDAPPTTAQQPPAPKTAQQPPAQRPLYDADLPPPQAAAPPPAYYGRPPYPGYQSTLPPRYWPGMPQQGRNWANPCTPYVCGYGSPYGYGYPPPDPYGYGYPPPYYYAPGPGIGFQFGPLSIWVP